MSALHLVELKPRESRGLAVVANGPKTGRRHRNHVQGDASMPKFQRILVPLDLSGDSMTAASESLALAGEFGAETLFLHAHDGVANAKEPRRPADAEALSRLEPLLAGRAGRIILTEGPPARRIPEVAREERVDLIVMATRGERGPRRWFNRSVTEQVMRHAPCPVWTSASRLAPAHGHPIRNILCAVSLGPRSRHVLSWAAALAERTDALLNVVHTSGDFSPHPYLPADGEWSGWMRAQALVEIRNLQLQTGPINYVCLEPGMARDGVPAAAERLGSDVIVIGRSPMGGLFPRLRGQSYDIVCQAPCPVASV